MKETVSPRLALNERDWSSLFENIAPILLGVTVLLIPYPRITSIKEIFFYLPVTLAVVLGIVRRQPVLLERRLLPFMLLFGCWAFFSSFFSLDPGSSLNDVFFHLFKYIFYYYAMVLLFTSWARLNALSGLFFVSLSLFVSILLIYFYGVENNSVSVRLGSSGLPEITTNLIAVITVVAFVFGLHLMFRTRSAAVRVLLFLALMMLAAATASTHSRAALLSLVTASGVFLFFRNRVVMVLCLSVLFLLSALVFFHRQNHYDPSGLESIETNIRIQLGLMAAEMVKDHPVTGIGFGTDLFGKRIDHQRYNQRLPEAYRLDDALLKAHTKEPHSMYTSIAVRTGLPGLGFFILFIGAFLLNGIRLMGSEDDETRHMAQCLFAAMVGLLLIGLFERCLSPITDMVFYTVVAMEGILIRFDREPTLS